MTELSVLPPGCSFEGDLVFDSISGNYINPSTGEVLTPESLPLDNHRQKRVIAPANTATDPTEWANLLSFLAFLGKKATRDSTWKVRESNPDLIIGQTVPWDEINFERIRNHHGIEFSIPADENSKRTPNCCEIEHTVVPKGMKVNSLGNLVRDPDIEEQEEIDIVPKNQEFFETLELMSLYFKKNPNAGYWKWLPTLFQFVADKINISTSSGEIGIPDLLSTVNKLDDQMRTADLLNDKLRKQLEQQAFELKNQRQKIKQLRKVHYGGQFKHS